MRIGVVQTNPAFGERRRNVSAAFALMERDSADLWVLPEFFASGYQFVDAAEVEQLAELVPDGPTTASLVDFCRHHNCAAVGGLPERAPDGVYNTAVLVGPDGFVGAYRKIHLFGTETVLFRPGDRPFSVWRLGEARIGVMVCYDHLFPEAARSLALLGTEIIAHPANLVLPGVAQQTTAVRALENGVFVATANRIGSEARNGRELRYTGCSQIAGPDGAILARLSADREEVASVDVDVARARSKAITSRNDKLADRRPHLYTLGSAT